MKAVVATRYGSPEFLEIRDVPCPVPRADEVLIRVHATTVNRTDCGFLWAKPFVTRIITGLTKPKQQIFGTEFAGTVEAAGAWVTKFQVGDRVFGFDDAGFGAHAEFKLMKEDKALAVIPEQSAFAEAAAGTEGCHYAYNFLNKVDLKSGDKVLVNGATGGIGSAAVQLLKALDVEVTAVCEGKYFEMVRSLGAVDVIDFTQEDFTQRDQKYHFVFDAVGKSTFARCKPLLLPGGVYLSSELGKGGENLLLASVTPLVGKKKVIFPLPTNAKRSVLLVKKLTEEGKFRAVIDKTYPLERIAEAYHYVESGQKIGSVVIQVAE